MVKDLLDPRIRLSLSQKETQAIAHVVTLALTCLRSNSKSSPSMQQVAHKLSASKHGNIPSKIGYVKKFDMSHNVLSGNVPFLSIKDGHYILGAKSFFFLSSLDLSYNNLTDNLPIELASIPHINLSFNFFECPQGCKNFYAKSTIGNTPLSVNSSVKDQNTKKSGHLVVSSSISFLWVYFVLFGVPRRLKFNQVQKKNRDLFFIWNYDGKIAFEDIIEATQDFDIRYCIATGTYDYVYRVQLSNGKIFALKKLH
ncbi:hypothetical protein Ahy_B06g084578 [Arachis hypogaea]|uniref:non-specific serine/threonine protein kinase n=1 Tax=Arachis hypogaea TaxID=3818 RepID=A0A444YSB0_ARAHY|nr:hypothetical protein Ahy_B06g084578 [Arachis hypogaea]